MTFLNLLEKRKDNLTKYSTESEIIFKKRLESSNINFKFQVILPPFIVDFVIDDRMLIIEIDGALHNTDEAQKYDTKRTRYLNWLGFTVLRIKNEGVNDWPLKQIFEYNESVNYLSAVGKAYSRIKEKRNSVIKRTQLKFLCKCGNKYKKKKNGRLVAHKIRFQRNRVWCKQIS